MKPGKGQGQIHLDLFNHYNVHSHNIESLSPLLFSILPDLSFSLIEYIWYLLMLEVYTPPLCDHVLHALYIDDEMMMHTPTLKLICTLYLCLWVPINSAVHGAVVH